MTNIARELFEKWNTKDREFDNFNDALWEAYQMGWQNGSAHTWNLIAVDNQDRSAHVINPPACVLSVDGVQNPVCKPSGNVTKVCDNLLNALTKVKAEL